MIQTLQMVFKRR